MSAETNSPSASRRGTPAFYAMVPTRATVFWRTFLPWQLWRFVRINLKMLRIIARSHHGQRIAAKASGKR
jgi:hypothetical protein